MANLLEAIRRSVLDSVKGRKLGLDNAGYIVGAPDIKVQVEDISTTAATTVSAYGITRVLTSGSTQGPTQHFLPAPIPGVEKSIMLCSTSTGSQQFLSTANGASIFATSLGTTVNAVNMTGPGGSVVLVGLTTAIWGVKSGPSYSSTNMVANVTFSTST